MKPKWRYNARLSARKGVEVSEGGADDLAAFYDLMRVTGERDDFGIHTASYYRRAWELFAPQGRAALLMAHYEGQPLAGLMVYAFNGQSWYMYGASSNAHRNLMSNHQLQWRAMQWARARGCDRYDLWGIPDVDDDPEEADLGGVGRFKAGFGGEVVRYVGAYDYEYSRPLCWLMRKALALRGNLISA
jgi:lipid II:glycine glycyltransferase (peptidoglycan interpeptide bridge formation enzyme)